MKSFSMIFFILILIFHPIYSKHYFVSNSGNNSNNGSIEAPFKTIQHSIDMMNNNDTCFIRAGEYRESFTVSNKQNITIMAYDNEYVLVLPTKVATNWELYKNSIYKSYIGPLNLSSSSKYIPFSQVFYNGKKMHMARYPNNITGNMFSLTDSSGYAKLEVKTGGEVVFDAPLPGGTDYWKGGYFRAIAAKHGGANPTGKIVTSSGKNISCDMISSVWSDATNGSSWATRLCIGKGEGYIFHLNALDYQGEWWYQNDTLYFYKPGNLKPTTDDKIEIQVNDNAVSMKNCSNITFEGINIKGGGAEFTSCSNVKIDKCSFRYLKGWFARESYAVSYTQLGGVHLKDCSDFTIKDSYFAKSWGSLLCIEGGKDNSVDNSIFEDNGWVSMFHSCIQNNSFNLQITQSTFGSTGRFHIRTDNKIVVKNCDFYDCMKVCQDAGSIESTNGGDAKNPVNLNGSVIAYNRFHDMNTLASYDGTKQFVVALYLEGVYNYTVHHNLIYNITNKNSDGAFVYLGPREVEIKNCYYYNNTVWNVDDGIRVWNRNSSGVITNVKFINNIFDSTMENSFGEPSLESSITFKNNYYTTNSNIFKDSKNGDFRLKKDAGAIDYGMNIDSITANYSGLAPDAGCYEYNSSLIKYGSTISPIFLEELDTNTTATKTDITQNDKIVIYPNPIIDQFYINIKEPITSNGNMFLCNTKGDVVKRLYQGKNSIKELTKGTYYVVVKDKKKRYIKAIYKESNN